MAELTIWFDPLNIVCQNCGHIGLRELSENVMFANLFGVDPHLYLICQECLSIFTWIVELNESAITMKINEPLLWKVLGVN